MTESKRRSSIVLWVIVGIAVFLVIWSFVFEIDQTVRSQGQIMTSTRTQVIQAADGGVLESLLVSEGQVVKAGETLAILEKERANAGVEEGAAKLANLKAIFARAKAESNHVEPVFPDELRRYPEFVNEQLAVYRQRKKTLETDLIALQDALSMAEQELLMHEKLHLTGDISQLELMRAKRMVIEGRSKIDTAKNKYKQDAINEAAKIQEDLMSQEHKLKERLSVLDHTVIKSPVDGVIKAMRVNTVGGVLRAGDELMQISPTGSDLLVEVKINPTDVGQLKLGLPVSIKVDAFDYSIYGTLDGNLNYIGSDTLTEQSATGQNNLHYRAHVNIFATQQNKKFTVADLKPGMTASVDIKTGERSVFNFVFKPVVKAFDGAGSQR